MFPIRRAIKEAFEKDMAYDVHNAGDTGDAPSHVIGRVAMHCGYSRAFPRYVLPDGGTPRVHYGALRALINVLGRWADDIGSQLTLMRDIEFGEEEAKREATTVLEARTQLWAVLIGARILLDPFWRRDRETDDVHDGLISAANMRGAELNALMAHPKSIAFLRWAGGTDYPATVRSHLCSDYTDTTPWLRSALIQQPWTHMQQSTGRKKHPDPYTWSLDILHFFP